jgi:hypothetical protein
LAWPRQPDERLMLTHVKRQPGERLMRMHVKRQPGERLMRMHVKRQPDERLMLMHVKPRSSCPLIRHAEALLREQRADQLIRHEEELSA